MTMAARKKRSESGQSMLEFAFLVPIVGIMLNLLIEVQGAISTAHVNQKYARQHLYYLFFNSRYYLEHDFLKHPKTGSYLRRMWMGVSNKSVGNPDEPTVNPIAPIRKIGRAKGSDELGEVEQRQKVRIRSLVFTCIPPVGGQVGQLFTEGYLGEDTFTGGKYAYCEDALDTN